MNVDTVSGQSRRPILDVASLGRSLHVARVVAAIDYVRARGGWILPREDGVDFGVPGPAPLAGIPEDHRFALANFGATVREFIGAAGFDESIALGPFGSEVRT